MQQNATDDAEPLSPSQALALTALLSGDTVTDAAKASGVSRETVHRWLNRDPQFIACLNTSKRELLNATRSRLRAIAGRAVDVLAGAMENPESPPAVKIKAAATILEMVGANTPEVIGETDAADVRDELAGAEESRQLRRLLRVRLGDSPDAADAATMVRKALGV